MSKFGISTINSISTFTVWLIFGLLISSNWQGVLLSLLFVLLPISCLVFWRSYVLSELLLNGKASLKLYAFDGFKWGIIFGCVFFTFTISSEVMAAGSALMGASFNDIAFYVFMFAIPTTFVIGLVGMFHSMLFYGLNRSLSQLTSTLNGTKTVG
ncbi:hypothetical protein RC854_004146 [Vibrio vulnificus]|uniref:hypothetical protein n=1 Tax=Vibrio vulnificus TaxID=672 RepID=UPI001029C21C|nr:hypothetical protein [Vibrio vulnificus]ELE1909087.1 hypothetical protein [Vibrio vulnificus]MCU8186002.1 hypothetical protein [Vibrio vulnificus]HAS6938503.1 hypothetical protein [Vibrio vulnificus]